MLGAVSIATQFVPENTAVSLTLANCPAIMSTQSSLPRSKRLVGPAKKGKAKVPNQPGREIVVRTAKPSDVADRQTAAVPYHGAAWAAA
jgi:hypothetical protein